MCCHLSVTYLTLIDMTYQTILHETKFSVQVKACYLFHHSECKELERFWCVVLIALDNVFQGIFFFVFLIV